MAETAVFQPETVRKVTTGLALYAGTFVLSQVAGFAEAQAVDQGNLDYLEDRRSAVVQTLTPEEQLALDEARTEFSFSAIDNGDLASIGWGRWQDDYDPNEVVDVYAAVESLDQRIYDEEYSYSPLGFFFRLMAGVTSVTGFVYIVKGALRGIKDVEAAVQRDEYEA